MGRLREMIFTFLIGEAPSELSEILKALEVAAASKNEHTQSKRAAPQSGLLTAPVYAEKPAPVQPTIKVAFATAGEKGPAIERNSKMGADYLIPATAAALVPSNKAVANAAPVMRENAYDRSRRGGGGRGGAASSVASAGVESKAAAEDSDGEASKTADGDGSSDSDEDWRSMRNRQKKTADRSTCASGSGSTAAHNSSTASGFWGAHGAPTTARVRENPVEVPLAGDSEDPRFNAFVAEYAAAHNVRFAESESEESDADDGDKREADVVVVSNGIGKSIALDDEAQEVDEDVTGVAATSAPSSPIREATAPTSREEPPQHMPMPPVPPVSPPKAPLSVSVPLSAQLPPAPVQALSGSLGAAAGRRPRGKAGSIMTAGKSRKPTEAAPQETAEETGAEAEPPSTSVDATAPTQLAVEHAALPAEPASTLVESAAETAPSTVVDEAALAVEEAARVAAERAAAVLKAMSLDLLHAAVLSPLPCAYVSNKSSGTTVEFPIGTLPSKLSSHGTAVDRLVLVDVDLARLRSADVTSCGDSSWVSVVAWVLQASGDKYGLLALQHGLVSTNGVELSVCRMVLETASEKFSAAELMEVAKATLLASVLSDKSAAAVPLVDDTINTVPAVSVADVLNIRDSYAAPLMADLEFFSAPLSYKAHLPHLCLTGNSLGGGVAGCSAATGMVSVRDVAVCAIKSHVLSSQHLNTHTAGASVGAVLSALVSKAERAGLRLCGMRLAHLNALELFEYEHFCSVPGYSRPVPPTTVTHASTSAYNQHVLPVLCLAFHSCNVSASDACSSTNKTGTTSVTNVAASVLRTLLGPDDPSLARKTDPTSLRALFGTSKEHNLVYPIPHSADRLFKETSFWFGGRAAVTSVSKNVTLLCVESPRTARIGVRLQIARSSINASSAARLSALQSAVLVAVSESMGAVGQLTALSSHTSTAAYRSAMKTSSVRNISSSVVTSDDAYSAEGGVASQCFVWEFCTHVGDLFLDQCVAGLLSRTSNVVAEDSWTLAADWSAGRGEANISATTEDINEVLSPDVLSGSKLLALDMLKKVSEDDCKSHEDVGLADVVALSIGDESTAAAAEPLLPVLVSVLGLLPRTCDTTVLAVKAQRNGAGMLALLRGYQIIENMDHAISEMQRIMSGNSSPGRPLQQKTSVAQSKAKFDTTESIHSLCYTVKAFKGKRALELIFTEFPTSSLFMDLALRDLHTYVPLPSLQRCGFTWLEQVAHSTAQFTAATGTSCMDSLISAPAQYLQALFPPGVFTAVGAIFVPWLPDSASFTRNLARVLTRLEKEHFEIIEIKAVAAVSEALVRQLYTENLSEYAPNTRGSGIAAPSSVKHVDTTSAVVAALKGLSVFAILVRRRSALLHLKSLIGPVFSSELAEAQYPRSLVCLLSSLGSSGSIVNTKSSASVDPIVPLILPTLSCSSALCVLEEVFHHFYASFDAQQAAVSLNLPSSGGAHAEHAHAADSANIEHLTEASVGTGMVAGELLRVPMNERLNSAGVASIATAEVELKSDIKKAGGEVDTLRKQVDMAGIVITHALLQEVGVGVILESLHREGLMVSFLFWSLVLPHCYLNILRMCIGCPCRFATRTRHTSHHPPSSNCSNWPALPVFP